jgi:hypothetical protein
MACLITAQDVTAAVTPGSVWLCGTSYAPILAPKLANGGGFETTRCH